MSDETPLDPDEAVGLIPDLSDRHALNLAEARNIIAAYHWLTDNPEFTRELPTPDGLRELHRQMFGRVWSWAGTFRQTQKSIGCEAWRIPTELHQACADLATWCLHESYPPSEVLARFHHRLVWIHPFPNGNGRWARLATDLIAEREGWPLPNWGAGDPSARDQYLLSLRRADITDFAQLILFIKDS